MINRSSVKKSKGRNEKRCAKKITYTVKLELNDSESGVMLPGVMVELSTIKKFTDKSGKASFKLAKGSAALKILDKKLMLDHMQYHGKSLKENTITVDSDLQIIAYLRPKAKPLDELVSEEPTAAQHFDSMMDEVESVLQEPEVMADRIGAVESSIVFKEHQSENETAVRLQEHLGLPKWQEEHPNAPEMWNRCLQLGKEIHPMVKARDELLNSVKLNVLKMREYAQIIRNKNLIEEASEALSQKNDGQAQKHLKELASHLRTMSAIVRSTKNKLAAIQDYNELIDSPKTICSISEKIKKDMY